MVCPSCGRSTVTALAPAFCGARNDDLEAFEAQSYYEDTRVRHLPPIHRCLCGNQDMRGRKKEPNRAIARALHHS